MVINIKKTKNSATCFGSLSHHQAKTIGLVHSVSAYTMGSHTVYKIILTFQIKFYSVSQCIRITE